MKARVAFMLALLVALTGLYLTANAAGNGEGPQPIAQASPVVTPVLCVVRDRHRRRNCQPAGLWIVDLRGPGLCDRRRTPGGDRGRQVDKRQN